MHQTGLPSPGQEPARRSYTPVDPLLLRQLAWLGNNLNQIARRVNSTHHPERLTILAQPVAIERCLTAIRRHHRC